MPTASPYLTTHALGMRFAQTPVLQGIDLRIGAGQFVLLTGPNGGGKTTLVRLLLGLLQPTEGRIARMPQLLTGYLPQYQRMDRQFPISVEEVVQSGWLSRTGLWGRLSADQHAHTQAVLHELALADLKDRPISALSGGQLQRVLFARAVVAQPHVLFLDEPDTYLDHTFQAHLTHLLETYAKRCTIVLVTHNPHGIERLATDIYRVDTQLHSVDRADLCHHHAGHVEGRC